MDFNKEFEVPLAQVLLPIDSGLDDLSAEMKSLFVILDELSANVKKVEASLKAQKAHFPFRWKVDERDLQQKHSRDIYKDEESPVPFPGYYFVATKVYLAWEEDELAKCYRLLLICEEVVIGEGGRIYSTKMLLKKPFIETDIKMRLEYAKYLIHFIDAFKYYLRDFRLSLESNDSIPF